MVPLFAELTDAALLLIVFGAGLVVGAIIAVFKGNSDSKPKTR